MLLSKLKASALHLLLSFVIISLAISLIIIFWFPDSLIQVSNFKEITLLIISIDLVVGPLLTFVVYKPKKKSLKFDLSTIAVIQISALAYGLFTLYQAHPVFITFNVDRFTLVPAIDAKPKETKYDSLKISTLSSPKLVIAKLPKERKELNELLLQVATEGTDIDLRPEYYHPYEDNINEILAKSLDPSILFEKPESKNKLDKFIKKFGKSKEDYAYIPLEGASKDAIWVLDKKTAKPIDIIDINPWIQKTAKK